MGNCAPSSIQPSLTKRSRSDVGLTEAEFSQLLEQDRREQRALLNTGMKSDDMDWRHERVIKSDYLDRRAAREHAASLNMRQQQKRAERERKKLQKEQKKILDQRKKVDEAGSFSANLTVVKPAHSMDTRSTANLERTSSMRSRGSRNWRSRCKRVRSDASRSVVSGTGDTIENDEDSLGVARYIKIPNPSYDMEN